MATYGTMPTAKPLPKVSLVLAKLPRPRPRATHRLAQAGHFRHDLPDGLLRLYRPRRRHPRLRDDRAGPRYPVFRDRLDLQPRGAQALQAVRGVLFSLSLRRWPLPDYPDLLGVDFDLWRGGGNGAGDGELSHLRPSQNTNCHHGLYALLLRRLHVEGA